MDLDDELQRLFQDDRLTMKVAPDAEKHVVAGARRVRRRRAVMMSAAGVLSAAVLTGGALMLAQPSPQSTPIADQPTSELPIDSAAPKSSTDTPPGTSSQAAEIQPPVRATTSNPRSNPETSKPTPGAPQTPNEPLVTLGPQGAGRFQLGMATTDLTAGGQAQPSTKTPAGCSSFAIRTGSGTAWAARNGTLVALVYESGVITPEHVTVDATQDAVKSAYPDFDGTTAKVPGNPDAKYRFTFSAGKVTSIALLADRQDCVN